MRARWYRSAVVLAAALLGIGIAIAVHAVGIHAARVASGSMSPSIDTGDWIVVRDLDRNDARTIRRGEIVVFTYPLGTTGRAIKRIVAIGGDTVKIVADAISVNGHPIPIAGAPSPAAARDRVEHIPNGHVFLLGDNTRLSIDSRTFGPVPDTDVVGRVLFTAPTPVTLSLLLAIPITVLASGAAVARRHRARPATPPGSEESADDRREAHRARRSRGRHRAGA